MTLANFYPGGMAVIMFKDKLYFGLLYALTAAISFGFQAQGQMVKGIEARGNVDRLMSDVHWFTSLRDAEDSGRQKDRPILWMHMLGKIDGAT